jgi:hypothetical protein
MMKDRQSKGVEVGLHQKLGGRGTSSWNIFGMVNCEDPLHQILQLVPYGPPNRSSDELLTWLVDAAEHYKKRLGELGGLGKIVRL